MEYCVLGQSTRQCDWCDNEFTPSEIVPSNCYDLQNAGISTCLDCCDKWTTIQLELHFDKIVCFLDEVKDAFLTFNGFKLPVNKTSYWKSNKRTFKRLKKHSIADVVDSYGHHWIAEKLTDGLCLLKPTGRARCSERYA